MHSLSHAHPRAELESREFPGVYLLVLDFHFPLKTAKMCKDKAFNFSMKMISDSGRTDNIKMCTNNKIYS